MKRSFRKAVLTLAVCTAGVVLQFPTSCAQAGLQQFVTSLNFCSILNCSGSSFFNLCDPTPTFVDCPNFVP